jgi:hypothetical protein
MRKRKVSVTLGPEDIEYVKQVSNHLGGASFSDTLRYIIKERRMLREEPWLAIPPPDVYAGMLMGGAKRGKKAEH